MKLLFTTKKRSPVSALIRFFTWSKYSHVDVIMSDENLVIGAYPGTGVTIAGRHQRVAESKRWAIMDLGDVPIEYVEEHLKSQIDKKYDWGGVLGFLSRRNWDKDDRWFCSELVVWACEQVGYRLFAERSNRITPRDLYISPMLEFRAGNERKP